MLKDLNQKLNDPVQKMLKFGRHVEQSSTIQLYYERKSGGKVPSRWQFSQFLEKKKTTLTSFGAHFGRFQVH